MDRRDFLKTTGGVLLAAGACAYAGKMLTKAGKTGTGEDSPTAGHRYGMVIDLTKCKDGCTACLDACREENNVAYFGDKRWDIHWIRKVTVKSKDAGRPEEKPVLLLCNHCDNPPCAQVCPVQATYKRHDGIVIVDHHRCIGCRYCMIACPYNARYFNFRHNDDWPNKDFPRRSHGVAEACNLCAHLLEKGEKPACVTACEGCGAAAIKVGNLNDPKSDVSKDVATKPVRRLRDDLGTEPKVYYIGL